MFQPVLLEAQALVVTFDAREQVLDFLRLGWDCAGSSADSGEHLWGLVIMGNRHHDIHHAKFGFVCDGM